MGNYISNFKCPSILGCEGVLDCTNPNDTPVRYFAIAVEIPFRFPLIDCLYTKGLATVLAIVCSGAHLSEKFATIFSTDGGQGQLKKDFVKISKFSSFSEGQGNLIRQIFYGRLNLVLKSFILPDQCGPIFSCSMCHVPLEAIRKALSSPSSYIRQVDKTPNYSSFSLRQ